MGLAQRKKSVLVRLNDQVYIAWHCYCFAKLRKSAFNRSRSHYELSFAKDLSKVRKMRGVFTIACVYKGTSRGLKPMLSQTWPLVWNQSMARCHRTGRTRSEICVSSRLNRDLKAVRHTGRLRIKFKGAGLVLFAGYCTQLARSFYYTEKKRFINALARMGSPFKTTLLDTIQLHCQDITFATFSLKQPANDCITEKFPYARERITLAVHTTQYVSIR